MDDINPNILSVSFKIAQSALPKMKALEFESPSTFPSEISFIFGYIAGYLRLTPDKKLMEFIMTQMDVGNKENNVHHLENTQELDDISSEPEIITSKDIKGFTKKKESPQKIEHKDSEENIAYIKKLQEEEEKAYLEEMQRRKKMNEDCESKMICNICLSELMSENVFVLDDCDHVFHESCIKEHCLSEIHAKKSKLICPDGECKTELNIENLREILGKKEVEMFYKNTLENYVDTHGADMSWCPTPDCKFAFLKHEEDDDTDFSCPLCKTRYCLNCRVKFHKGQTCKEYQISNTRDKNDDAFEKFVKGKKFKQCPKCIFWVEKNQGCDHMTCRCGFQFCYKCGGVFMQCECIEKQKLEMERRKNMNMKRKLKNRKK